ncbi:hypothetical protein CN395_29395 [Priestia megaterium]|uniref:nucleotide disphospho-sugar-binding domain-containing protein n=1 Tax=Priestia megaterium TaxID=1404 RepID=UPI000BF26FAD|nr:nucleotide disphospho-sugar-binding domain-containing protein [Priestia megaterium]PEU50773.1 hypothetical protein CN395_29395 [Priestia megaterium]
MKLLFLISQSHGHINPTLPIAKELVRRGDKIVYYSIERYIKKIKEIGAEVKIIDDVFGFTPEKNHQVKPPTPQQVTSKLSEYLSTQLRYAHTLFDAVSSESYDGIIYDPMCVWGHAIANQINIPKATFHSSIVIKPNFNIFKDFFSLPYQEIPKEIKMIFTSEEDLNLVPVLYDFQPEKEKINSSYKFISPTIIKRNREKGILLIEKIKDKKLIYISLGSVLNNPKFYAVCIEAFKNTDWQVVMVAKSLPDNVDIPKNFIIMEFAPQLDILPHTDIFISHGGMNSVNEALWFGVPMVIIPQNADQPFIANKIMEKGLGKTLQPSDLSAKKLKFVTEALMEDKDIKETLRKTMSVIQTSAESIEGADTIQYYFRDKLHTKERTKI